MTYTLRVSVKTLGQTPISGIDGPMESQLAGRATVFQLLGKNLIICITGFVNEAEAESFLPHVKAGLWNIAIVQNVAFVPEFPRREITLAEDPIEAGMNLAKSFGLDDTSPVHGLANEGGYSIFRTGHNIKFVGVGDITATVSSPFERLRTTFAEGLENADKAAVEDSKLHTAISLYLIQFFENSQRARLLTLMMVLEVLAPDMAKHHTAVQMLQRLTADINLQLAGCTDEEEQFALESLARELDFRKETSIRRRVRELVLSSKLLPTDDRRDIASNVIRAYDLRGQLVHTGQADEVELNKAFNTVFQVTKVLLREKLGLHR